MGQDSIDACASTLALSHREALARCRMDAPVNPDTDAAARAERQTDIHFDFELEDIIAGNTPASDVGRTILAIVENGAELPTQGKIETALIPLYEAMTAEFYRAAGGKGEAPQANRQSVEEHAVKVIQARKVKRTAKLRATRAPRPQPAFLLTGFQLGAAAVLIAVIVLVAYLRS